MRDPKNKYRLYRKAQAQWGTNAQCRMAIEECSELILALLQTNSDKIYEEMADVEIMLEQLKVTFGSRDLVKFHKLAKLKRLKERLNETD